MNPSRQNSIEYEFCCKGLGVRLFRPNSLIYHHNPGFPGSSLHKSTYTPGRSLCSIPYNPYEHRIFWS